MITKEKNPFQEIDDFVGLNEREPQKEEDNSFKEIDEFVGLGKNEDSNKQKLFDIGDDIHNLCDVSEEKNSIGMSRSTSNK